MAEYGAAGQTLRMERGGAVVMIEDRLGEGNRGVALRARGAPLAVNWLRDRPYDEIRKSITALIQRGRPPHPAFMWPIGLVSSDQAERFDESMIMTGVAAGRRP